MKTKAEAAASLVILYESRIGFYRWPTGKLAISRMRRICSMSLQKSTNSSLALNLPNPQISWQSTRTILSYPVNKQTIHTNRQTCLCLQPRSASWLINGYVTLCSITPARGLTNRCSFAERVGQYVASPWHSRSVSLTPMILRYTATHVALYWSLNPRNPGCWWKLMTSHGLRRRLAGWIKVTVEQLRCMWTCTEWLNYRPLTQGGSYWIAVADTAARAVCHCA